MLTPVSEPAVMGDFYSLKAAVAPSRSFILFTPARYAGLLAAGAVIQLAVVMTRRHDDRDFLVDLPAVAVAFLTQSIVAPLASVDLTERYLAATCVA